ncbi:HSP20-like chaperone [Dunaliella salina]|uniref:HSP20-like chaperone n=1 Tax=Dunaliella salina TaxID=3046 RepID=A0ABQ7H7X7_DUNSA|nr:HSP20-like chaperone [Dunaliella salina]|eukprot:KAF5842953.1 HSP20-like chaperone [Dunaliella salina]
MALSMLNLDPYFLGPLMEQALNRTLGRSSSKQQLPPPSHIPALHINCDVVEKPNSYAIIADAPGMTSDDIHVELQDGVLKVSGEKSMHHEERQKNDKVWRQERSFRKFQRCFSLPEDAQPDSISASLEHGVLTVEIPKMEQKKVEPRRIQVVQGTAK